MQGSVSSLQNNIRQKMPLISIITVVYNAGKQLEETIQSVLGQTYKNIEYIIIDGGSTDGTLNIIKKYERQLAYHISEPDNGIYDAMNKGIARAGGNWVYFVGAGDTLLNVLDKLAPYFTDPNCIYYGDVYRHDMLRLYDGKFSPFKLAVNNICQQAIFYPLSALHKYTFNTKYRMMADHNLNMQCYGDRGFKFKYLPIVVANYEGAGFSEQNLDTPFFRDKMNIVKTNFPFIVYWYAAARRMMAKLIKGTNYTA